MPNEYPAASLEDTSTTLVTPALLDDLTSAGVAYDLSVAGRADHGRDWWPLSIPDVAAGRVPRWPGVVVRAASSDDVSSVLRAATKHHVAVTPQGGRSGVEGGAVAPEGAIALDLTGLDRVLDVDTVSGTVSVEAGVFGPDLERAVAANGWTVGHFPQSFALATVGGWIACRGAGQYSNRYGKIEDIVRSLSVVLASGERIELGGRRPAPGRRPGPDATLRRVRGHARRDHARDARHASRADERATRGLQLRHLRRGPGRLSTRHAARRASGGTAPLRRG